MNFRAQTSMLGICFNFVSLYDSPKLGQWLLDPENMNCRPRATRLAQDLAFLMWKQRPKGKERGAWLTFAAQNTLSWP